MRILVALSLWVVLVGGVALYMDRRATAAPIKEYKRVEAEGRFVLEVTCTFSAEPDPFGLALEGSGPSALLLNLDGKEILRKIDTVSAFTPMRVDPVPGLKVGMNEFFVEANPASEELTNSVAVRVRILLVDHEGEAGDPVADHTIWSEPGVGLQGTFVLEIKPDTRNKHGHDH